MYSFGFTDVVGVVLNWHTPTLSGTESGRGNVHKKIAHRDVDITCIHTVNLKLKIFSEYQLITVHYMTSSEQNKTPPPTSATVDSLLKASLLMQVLTSGLKFSSQQMYHRLSCG